MNYKITKVYWRTWDLMKEFDVSQITIYNWEKILNIKPDWHKGRRQYNSQQHELFKQWALYRKRTKTDLIKELISLRH